MMRRVRRRAAAPLTAASFILATASSASASLRDSSSSEVPCDLTDDTENDGVATRARAAEELASMWPDATPRAADDLRRLARDTSDSVRISAAVGLARAIERASAPERIDLVCTWALSEDDDERLALARALTWSTPVFVADLVLEQLATDASPFVRAAALAAVARHFHENSRAYARIASRCEADSDPSVRKLARALMMRARA